MKKALNIVQINIEGMEDFKRCSDNVAKLAQQLEVAVQNLNECKLKLDVFPKLENIDRCEELCNTPFVREDLEDIISDLQEEYYKTGKGNVLIKIQIADAIDRLCRLRNTLLM